MVDDPFDALEAFIDPSKGAVRYAAWVSAAQEADMIPFMEELPHRSFPEKTLLLVDMITQPSDFAAPFVVLERIVQSGMDFNAFFEVVPEIGNEIWGMYAADPGEEVAQMGGLLAAEYLRHRLLTDLNYTVDIRALIETPLTDEEDGLAAHMNRALLRDSFVVIQNALVDHVAGHKDGLMTTGAGFLGVLNETDVKPETLQLWTRKIDGLESVFVSDARVGNIPTLQPVFKP